MRKSYYDRIFERTSLYNVAWNIQNGDAICKDEDNFGIREENAHQEIEKLLKQHLPEEKRLDIENALDAYSHVRADTSFILGMKIGARLIVQLLTDPDNDHM
jgi:hypothetical protein